MPTSTFQIYDFDGFAQYIWATNFSRKIQFLQNHHTWLPDYKEYNRPGTTPMMLLENMRRDHIQARGWNDIGQNLTTFPNGLIGLCRAMDITPAGIYGANTGAICIENLGNFDKDKDVMTDEQNKLIIKLNALLCLKFGLIPNDKQVVYHHWFDIKGKRFSDDDINSGKVLQQQLQKTCPGTNFFPTEGASYAGDTITAAQENFYPKILVAMEELKKADHNHPSYSMKVTVNKLFIRTGKGTSFLAIGSLYLGNVVQVWDVQDGWAKVNQNPEQWVSLIYLINLS
ncbi:MAG: N-acetylmuramoyl-L-alanine amidase [Flavisolibacter sp.]